MPAVRGTAVEARRECDSLGLTGRRAARGSSIPTTAPAHANNKKKAAPTSPPRAPASFSGCRCHLRPRFNNSSCRAGKLSSVHLFRVRKEYSASEEKVQRKLRQSIVFTRRRCCATAVGGHPAPKGPQKLYKSYTCDHFLTISSKRAHHVQSADMISIAKRGSAASRGRATTSKK